MTPRQILERYPLFAALDRDKLDAWIASGSEFSLQAGETLFAAGSPGLWIYAVLEGRVRVVRSGLLREVSLGVYGPGEMLGEYALLPPGKNVSTCRMATAGRLFQIPLAQARPMIAAHRRIQSNLRRWVQLDALTAYLRDQNFLGFMSAPSVLELREKLVEAEFPAGSSIQAEALAANRWFFIIAGEVELRDPAGVQRATCPKRVAGECFGQEALLGAVCLPHAVACRDTRCLSLDRGDFGGAGLEEQSVPTGSVNSGFPWIGQEAVQDCGLAALAMIWQFHGRRLTIGQLRDQAQLERGGVSLAELARLACDFGFRAQAVQIHAAQYAAVRPPAVVHYRSGHYVVMYRYDDTGVTVGDPAAGVVRMARGAFHAQASGAALVLTPWN